MVLCLIIIYSSYYSGRVLETLFIHHPHQQSIVKFIANQMLMAAQFSTMLISTFWVNARCEHIIQSQRYEIHQISRKSVYEQNRCIEIAPKPKKVMNQIQVIQRKGTVSSYTEAGPPDMERKRSPTFSRYPSRSRSRSRSPQPPPSPVPPSPVPPSPVPVPSLTKMSSRSVGSPTSRNRVRSASSPRAPVSPTTGHGLAALRTVLADDSLIDLFARHLVKVGSFVIHIFQRVSPITVATT